MARRLLAIESATDWLSVALLEDERVIEVRRRDARMQHSTALLPTIDGVLEAAGVDLGGVEAMAVSSGPGSFTSLRIGLATVKGLAFRRAVELIGVSTLEAMALAVLESQDEGPPSAAGGGRVEAATQVVALLDARRGEWYAGGFSRAVEPGRQPLPQLAEGLYAPERLAAACDGPVTLVAPDPGGCLEALETAGVALSGRVVGEAARPDAVWVGRLGQRLLDAGKGVSARSLRARYLRRAEAEAKRLGGPVEEGEVADLGTPGEGG